MRPISLRVFVALVGLAVLVLGAVPLLVLLDLAGGGTGWGTCPQGLSGCRAAFLSGPRLALILAATIFVLLSLLRLVVWATGRSVVRRRRIQEAARNWEASSRLL